MLACSRWPAAAPAAVEQPIADGRRLKDDRLERRRLATSRLLLVRSGGAQTRPHGVKQHFWAPRQSESSKQSAVHRLERPTVGHAPGLMAVDGGAQNSSTRRRLAHLNRDLDLTATPCGRRMCSESKWAPSRCAAAVEIADIGLQNAKAIVDAIGVRRLLPPMPPMPPIG